VASHPCKVAKRPRRNCFTVSGISAKWNYTGWIHSNVIIFQEYKALIGTGGWRAYVVPKSIPTSNIVAPEADIVMYAL
jgi:hypothetical protein